MVNRPHEFRSWSILTLSPLDRVMARQFAILSFTSVNETVWCYQLNESSLVELLLSAIFFSGVRGKISLKKKSGIFVSFPFSTLRSEMRSTLSILLYVNVGVAEN